MRGFKIAGLVLVAILVLLLLALWSVLGTQAGSRWALGQVPGLSVENFQAAWAGSGVPVICCGGRTAAASS